ncbi:hypothetical protein M5X00_25770 [Paenibacillus alvei]|uniref:hypothetical protein n=1 Tax=Paenibacillus alvei TaxID=44250 RepID=UPI00028830D5|nr:hypothetical protein [Paenibacillus alvei]EJW13985.1 hypothetical protein PAV_141p00910 [Paenibacillus alvei DSM 29]MCY9707653.1 hypothetical protein [Paenibacillus alvei]MCY9757638.1 hypothetical protein [Paenibacillus alvei]MEC0082835.1 hypothetical protein [Paenibacillus alvei]
MAFKITNKEEFDALKNKPDVKKVEYGAQFDTLLSEGELIFFEMSDGYGSFRIKKGFGLSKPKGEIYMLKFEEKIPQIYENKDIKKLKGIFDNFFKKEVDMFYIEGLR